MDDPEIKLLFPTPLLLRDLPLTEQQNDRIAESILEREKQSQSPGRSNVRGWRSQGNFFAWDTPEIKELLLHCRKGVEQMTRQMATGKLWGASLNLYAWANVMRAGGFHPVHDHSECAWAGVYYCKTEVRSPDDGTSGLIEFVDPRAAVTGGFTPGNPFDMDGRIAPRDGLLIIFPGWLKHIVYPFAPDGDGLRVSIAFNAEFSR